MVICDLPFVLFPFETLLSSLVACSLLKELHFIEDTQEEILCWTGNISREYPYVTEQDAASSENRWEYWAIAHLCANATGK